MRKILLAVTVVGLLAFAGSARAETVREEETGTTFETPRTIAGATYVLTGVGAREAMGTINVYGAGMYVEARAAAKAWGSYLTGRFAKAGLVQNGQPDLQKIARSPQGRHFMVYGRMPKAIDLSFVRDVRADQVQGAYEESWDRVRLDREAAGEALGQFMAAVNHPVRNGQHMMIRTAGNNVWVTMPGQGTTRIRANRALVIALWKVYFGNPPLQRRLRDGLMSMLRNVHALFTAGQ